MRKKGLSLITALSILSALVWLVGLAWVLQDQFFADGKSRQAETMQPDTPQKQKDNSSSAKKLQIAAIGDSLTRGTGDPDGKGYIGYLKEELAKKTKKEIELTNSAIKGQTSSQLIKQIQQPQIQRQIKNADVILLTIGGNDLFRGGQALEELDSQNINKTEDAYLSNLKAIYKEVRSLNKSGIVYHVGLYNPFSDMKDSKTTSGIVRKWNYDSANAAAAQPNIIYVPTFDLFELNVNDYLYSDHFHPNKQGYQLIGERTASLIRFSEEDQK
ncbi:GDSL-type esterase/lipase family protein [Fictibacillus fluitans]|uniref:GDSL-type esterase/lipase family protein n=1 Tax=Fictibacillus fluitans TaxID=3058422 RepID=A0ABT8HU68_9BACL|nr:GDSL-type esterase/lipase family protein [Fictibacillus sp. NE201]MDN4524322.1 GDSL-type esterase/lipase family protein [Fictibacillus sp. NE201]